MDYRQRKSSRFGASMSHILFAVVLCFTSTVTGADFTLDVDGNGEATPLTDGLLILRHQFGFTDDALESMVYL